MSQHGPLTIQELEQLDERGRGKILVARDEDQWFERKGARVSPSDLADVLIGLANAQGGLVAIGIANGEIEGVDGLTEKINAWTQAGIDHAEPAVSTRVAQLRCRDGAHAARLVALVEVPAGQRLHRDRAGQVWLRVGGETRRLTAEQAQLLAFEKGSPHFDGTVVADATTADIDPARVRAYVAHLPVRVRPQEALRSRGLLQRSRDGVVRPTAAAILLFGRTPQAHFPGARLRVLQYDGRTREVGAQMNVLSDVQFDGTLVEQIDRAKGRIRTLLPATIRLDRQYGRFASLPVLPQEAWEEAVTNAVLHRSYALSGDHVRVEIFTDRLEVTSPGRLPGPVTLSNITRTRYARNPSIARILTEMGHARELTEGVKRMFDLMEAAGFARPLLAEGSGTFTVTFLFDSSYARILDVLPSGSDRLVTHLVQSGGRVKTAEAMSLLGLQKPATLRHLRRLAENGLIVRREQSANDPTGYWQVQAPASERRARARSRRRAG